MDIDTKKVKKFGTGGHITVPKNMVGKDVSVIYDEEVVSKLREITLDDLKEPQSYEKNFGIRPEEIYKADNSREGFTDLSNTLKKEIDKLLKEKKSYTTEELNRKINNIKTKMKSELDRSAETFFKNKYQDELEEVGRNLGINVEFKQRDLNAIKALSNQDVLSKAFSNLSDELSQKVGRVITESYTNPEELTTEKITEKVKDALDIADYRAETIARTETSKVSAAARKNSYAEVDPEGTGLYKHIGPNDNRTTKISQRIKDRTKNGVTWDEYIRIMEEESRKEIPNWKVNPEFPISHPNTRHTFIKIG